MTKAAWGRQQGGRAGGDDDIMVAREGEKGRDDTTRSGDRGVLRAQGEARGARDDMAVKAAKREGLPPRTDTTSIQWRIWWWPSSVGGGSNFTTRVMIKLKTRAVKRTPISLSALSFSSRRTRRDDSTKIASQHHQQLYQRMEGES